MNIVMSRHTLKLYEAVFSCAMTYIYHCNACITIYVYVATE